MRPLLVRLCLATALVVSPAVPLLAEQADKAASLDGVWSLNTEASDGLGPDAQNDPSGRPGAGRGAGRSGGRGGGAGRPGGRGGFGGGAGRGGGRGGADRDQIARRLDAMRDIVRPAARLTISHTATMVIIVTDDGTTTRLVPDESRIKDESTGIERRTRWDGPRLSTELTGIGRGRITETHAIDAATGQLVVTLQLPPRPDSDEKTGRTLRRVYDPVR